MNVDPATHTVNAISIPRDSKVYLSVVYRGKRVALINHARHRVGKGRAFYSVHNDRADRDLPHVAFAARLAVNKAREKGYVRVAVTSRDA